MKLHTAPILAVAFCLGLMCSAVVCAQDKPKIILIMTENVRELSALYQRGNEPAAIALPLTGHSGSTAIKSGIWITSMNNKIRLLFAVGLVAFSLNAGLATAQDRPHIVYINADDLGVMDVGFNNPIYNTPNQDQLRKSGHAVYERICPSRELCPEPRLCDERSIWPATWRLHGQQFTIADQPNTAS